MQPSRGIRYRGELIMVSAELQNQLKSLRRVVEINKNGKKLIIHKELLFACVGGKMIWEYLTSDIILPAEKPPVLINEPLDGMIKKQIEYALRRTGGNRRLTAKRLGVGERTLYRQLVKYNLSYIKSRG